jgi:MOSC domain-containing protein YiiM
MTGRVVSVNISTRTGEKKAPQPKVELAAEHGIRGDAHAGDWHRQVSLLAMESIQKMRDCGADVGPGAFAENVTTEGVVVHELPVGTRLRLGDSLCEVTQIGKVCHDRCAIFNQVGDCVMPREGIFVRILQGGTLRPGDVIEVLESAPAAEGDAPAGAEADRV